MKKYDLIKLNKKQLIQLFLAKNELRNISPRQNQQTNERLSKSGNRPAGPSLKKSTRNTKREKFDLTSLRYIPMKEVSLYGMHEDEKKLARKNTSKNIYSRDNHKNKCQSKRHRLKHH